VGKSHSDDWRKKQHWKNRRERGGKEKRARLGNYSAYFLLVSSVSQGRKKNNSAGGGELYEGKLVEGDAGGKEKGKRTSVEVIQGCLSEERLWLLCTKRYNFRKREHEEGNPKRGKRGGGDRIWKNALRKEGSRGTCF